MNKPLIILTGPTAVGKTAISIELAKKVNGEIISADSMQVYKGMDIGTAKIKKEEMQGIKHYLIDEFEPDEEFNISVFQKLSKKYINSIIEKGKIPLIVGGTGFYIQSVVYDVEFSEMDIDINYRNELLEISRTKGCEYLHNMLRNVDENSANTIHPNNVKRVIRALEFYQVTNQQISKHNQEQRQKDSPYNFVYFVLNTERKILYDRINQRIDKMIREGLIEEVELLKNKGYSKKLISMQGLGYKEILDYLDGIISLDEAINILKRDTRHFAKRQLTWFRREKMVYCIEESNFQNFNEIIKYMLKVVEENGII